MSNQHFKGLTWDHPRGYRALEAAAELARANGLFISWERQPLEGFESRPIKELCDNYDLIIMDHPHIGDAVELNCLQPIDELISPRQFKEIEKATIGPCLASYQLNGHTWALPLDAASQVMAFRPDLVAGEAPQTWEEVCRFTPRASVALSLAGPHALPTYFSIAASLEELPAPVHKYTFKQETLIEAFEILREIYAGSNKRALDKNPIELLNYMARENNVVLCPLVFGYVNFARPSKGVHALVFLNAPRRSLDGKPGSTLGGTGIGISRRCKVSQQLIAHFLWLLSSETQTGFIPEFDGQPSRREAWNNSTVNSDANNFYTATFESMEAAYVRPRHEGFVPLQLQASQIIRQALEDGTNGRQLIVQLNALNHNLLASREAVFS